MAYKKQGCSFIGTNAGFHLWKITWQQIKGKGKEKGEVAALKKVRMIMADDKFKINQQSLAKKKKE